MRDDLPHAMRETARRLEPDVVRLVAGGVSRGTRMRRIERIERVVQVLGSVVAVAVVFAGVGLFGPYRTAGGGGGRSGGGGGGDGGADQAPVSGSGTGNASRTATPSPSDTPATTTAPSSTAAPQISGSDLIGILKTCLAGSGVTGRSYAAWGSDYAWPTKIGPASVFSVNAQLAVANQVGFISIVAYGAQEAKHVPKLGEPLLRADGAVAYVSQAPGSSDGQRADRLDLDVTLVRTDGSSLFVLETNAADDKSAAPAGARLLLSSDQVIAMVDSPAWDAALGAADMLPLAPETPPTVPSDAAGTGTVSVPVLVSPGPDWR